MSSLPYSKTLQLSKKAIYARQQYQLKKQIQEDVIPLSLLKKKVCSLRKKLVKKVIQEEFEGQLFSQSIMMYDSD
jgi:hypothetical protein